MVEAAEMVRPGGPEAVVPWTSGQRYIDADQVPLLREARHTAYDATLDLFESRMQQLRDGEFDAVPNPVDPLSTAQRALEAREAYGPESQEYADAFTSLLTDCQRLLAEAMRKNTWEYFPFTEQVRDTERGNYLFYGRSLSDIVADGITPIAEPEERERRQNEFIEEHTYVAIGGTALLGAMRRPMSVATISECPDWAIEAYQNKTGIGFGGYVPEKEKLMVRSVRFDPLTGNREQEQLGMVGTYVTHEIVQQALEVMGVMPKGQTLTKSEVHNRQIISTQGDDVMTLVELLDTLASDASGKRIFLGEEAAEHEVRDYACVPALAAERQARLMDEAITLAEYIMSLVEDGVDSYAAEGLVENFVQRMLFDAVKHDPEQAALVFDQATADGLREVERLRVAGQMEEAILLEGALEAAAPPVVYCGAGSCGLEAVGLNSAEGKAALALGLEAKQSKELLHDKERKCPNCKELKVYYDMKNSKVCIGCGSRKINKKQK